MVNHHDSAYYARRILFRRQPGQAGATFPIQLPAPGGHASTALRSALLQPLAKLAFPIATHLSRVAYLLVGRIDPLPCDFAERHEYCVFIAFELAEVCVGHEIRMCLLLA